MPKAKKIRRQYQGQDFIIGFLREAAKNELAKKERCNTRLVIEIAHILAAQDRCYDVEMFVKGRRPAQMPEGLGKVGDGVEAAKDFEMSEAVTSVLETIRGRNGSTAETRSVAASTEVSDAECASGSGGGLQQGVALASGTSTNS